MNTLDAADYAVSTTFGAMFSFAIGLFVYIGTPQQIHGLFLALGVCSLAILFNYIVYLLARRFGG